MVNELNIDISTVENIVTLDMEYAPLIDLGLEVTVTEGLQGIAGYTPIKGVDYFDGEQGPIGPQGPAGPASTVPGPQGPQGPKGDDAELPEGIIIDTEYQSVKSSALSAIQEEVDPIFSSSAAYSITTEQVNSLHAPGSDNQEASDFDIKDLSDSTGKRSEWDSKSDSDHNHSLINLAERSYNSLTDQPNLALLEDVINIQFFSDNEPLVRGDGDLWYQPASYGLYVFSDLQGWMILDYSWKIYVNKDTESDFYGKIYIYNGIELILVPDSLVLGETSTTAFDGLRGKAAYDHAGATGNPHGTTYSDVNAASEGHDHFGTVIQPNAIILKTQYTDITAAGLLVGSTFYNVDQLCWMTKTSSDTYYNWGEELPMLCVNTDVSTHLEGTAVYISSGTGQFPLVQLASSAVGKCDAVATQDVLSTGNKRGYYCFFGQVRKFPYANVKKSTDNENTWVDGASLYLCSELGKYSTTKEDAPAKSIKIATITNRSGANITIMFTPEACSSVDDLCDVDGVLSDISDNDELLIKENATSVWKKFPWSSTKTKLAATFATIANPTFTGTVKAPVYQDQYGNEPFVAQNGGTIYHTTAWITGTTVSTINNRLIKTGGSNFSSAMVGAKVKVGNEERIISAYVDGNTVDVTVNFSQNYSGVGFGVYSVERKINNGFVELYSTVGFLYKGEELSTFGADTIVSTYYRGINNGNLRPLVIKDTSGTVLSYFRADGGIYGKFISTTDNTTAAFNESGNNTKGLGLSEVSSVSWGVGAWWANKDLGLARNSAGLLEINNGTVGQYRDLLLRNLTATGEIIAPKSKHTIEGGLAIKLTNKTGAASVKGTLVNCSSTTDNAFSIETSEYDTIGVVYESGIADGSECWVVISGIAEVLLADGTASTRGYWVYADATDGRANATTQLPAGGTIQALENHFKEIGHCIESKTAGTNVLAKVILHFN